MAKGTKKLVVKETVPQLGYEPLLASVCVDEQFSRVKVRNGRLTKASRYRNIEELPVPFKYSTSGHVNHSGIDVRDAVELCQKTYYGVAIFRNTIDLMTEFSCSRIYFKGGNKASRDFFENYFKSININSIEDRFFREYYRSGNVFFYRMMGTLEANEIRKLNQVYGSEMKASTDLPLNYVILNPIDVQVGGSLSFASPVYYKIVSDYELQILRNPVTEKDKAIYDGLPEKVKEQISNEKQSMVLIPLDKENTRAIFYKKQDYEPFAFPMGFPVLADINWKLEMKKMDAIISRTMQQSILLVTMGESPKDGGAGVNQDHIEKIQKFFMTESVARVLVADYTTKASFVTPDIGDLMDPKKYEQVDKDIKEGLNNLLVGGDDKFANATIKIQVFIERLRQARETFKNEFLIPEIKAIAQAMKFKVFPEPFFEEIEFKDELEFAKLYTRLMEIGVLTAAEGIEAFETGKLPDKEASIEDQTEYQKLRDKGYYEPLVGGPQTQKEIAQLNSDTKLAMPKLPKGKGRPSGSKAPQSKKKMTPIGGFFSLAAIRSNLLAISALEKTVEKKFCQKYRVKNLTEEQQETVRQVAEIIVANEDPSNWTQKAGHYLENPVDQNEDRINEIHEIAAEHQIETSLAAILYHSQTNAPE